MGFLIGFIFTVAVLIGILSLIGVIILPIAGIALGIAFVAAILSLAFNIIKCVFSLPMLIIIVVLAVLYRKRRY